MVAVTASIRISASRARVLRAFLDTADLQKWWGLEHALVDSHTDGVWVLSWKDTVMTGVIGSLKENEFLHINNLVCILSHRSILGPMQLTVTVGNDEGKTLVTVRQDGFNTGSEWESYREVVQQNWPQDLERLRDHLESAS